MRTLLARVAPILVCALALCAAGSAGATGTRASSARAAHALAAARAAFAPHANGRDATLALRDLAEYRHELSPGDARRASALLARPGLTDQVWCTVVCLHWDSKGPDAPPPRDANGNGRPDWVETTMAVLQEVWQKEIVEFGFRPPKSDLAVPDHGPDGRLDVYLKDIANDVLGYCAPEPFTQTFDSSGYCVLDNDYSLAQVGPPSYGGKVELELTVAHEFFHAVQFGYDFTDDTWLLEGTAVWMEDEVYNSINEGYAYLLDSPLVHPEVPVDYYTPGKLYQYGAWIFWRFFEELFSPPSKPRDPSVIRRVWEFADASPGASDLYSLSAADAVAREHGSSFGAAFATFGAVNSAPRSFYQEGAHYPASPLDRTFALSARRRQTGPQQLTLDHMTNRHVAFVPGSGLKETATLAVTLDLPPVTEGSEATLLTFERSGKLEAKPLQLDFGGNGSVRVPFGRGAVSKVILVLTNASQRFHCRNRTRLSCEGTPLDDKRRFDYRARVS